MNYPAHLYLAAQDAALDRVFREFFPEPVRFSLAEGG
jgi:hypothetical protein